MIRLPIKRELYDYSKKLVEENNFGQRGKDDGSPKEQFIGILSENMVRQYLELPLIEPKGFDGGYDIMYKNKKADIKSMNRTVDPKPFYINNVFDVQLKHESEAYIFTSLNTKKKNLSICGWVLKEDFKKRATFYAKGTVRMRGKEPFALRADNWEIKNEDLDEFSK